MMKMRLAGLMAILLCLFGIAGMTDALAAQTIKIGLITPLTTANALIGWGMEHSAIMGVKEINEAGGIKGKKIELISEDNANTNAIAVNALNKVLASKPVGLVVGSTSSQTMAMSPIIQKAKIPTLIEGGSPKLTDHGNPWFFQTRVTDEFAAIAASRFVVQHLKKTKVGIFHAAEEFGISAAQVNIKALEEMGQKPVAVVSAPSGDKDVSAQLLQIKNAGADVLMAWVLPAPGVLLARQMKQLKIDIPLMGNVVYTMPQTLKLMTPEERTNIYSITDTVPEHDKDPAVQDFVKRYKERTGMMPDLLATMSYDNVKLFAKVIEEVGTDPEAMRKAFHRVKNYKGITNVYTFDEKGRGAWRMVVVDISSDDLKVLTTISR